MEMDHWGTSKELQSSRLDTLQFQKLGVILASLVLI